MRLSLTPHPGSSTSAISSVKADVEWLGPGLILLHYCVVGDIGAVRLPAPAEPGHKDGLWNHTCFEAFFRVGEGPSYMEFNFAPSRQWAAYRFDSYRRGMSPETGMAPAVVESMTTGHGYELRSSISLGPIVPVDRAWQVGLSAVIEEMDGNRSFWALAHAPGPPDFHHSDCFAYKLPAA